MATNKPKKSQLDGVNALRVSSRPETFRRAGFVFTREPQVLMLADLTQEQDDALCAENMLVVEQITVPATAAE